MCSFFLSKFDVLLICSVYHVVYVVVATVLVFNLGVVSYDVDRVQCAVQCSVL